MSVERLSLADCSLAYQRLDGDTAKPGVVFLCGFASDMEGSKAVALAKFCADRNVRYIRFDYRGCGQSAGNFAEGTIGAWHTDSLAILDHLTQGPQIVVGSSMGGWQALLLAKARPQRLRALIGVAAAPDFTEDLIWDKLPPDQRALMEREGAIYEEGDEPGQRIPITHNLIKEARAHLVLRSPLSVPCPVRLLQGMEDKEVPWQTAVRIVEHIDQPDAQAILVKDGNHRLSTPDQLALLTQTVAAFL